MENKSPLRMENNLRFGAVDIGSNAIRLFFCYVIETSEGPIYKKASLVRLPIRLGDDVFNSRPIQGYKIEELILGITAFKNLMQAYNLNGYRACATSAMRNAVNGDEIIQRIKEACGIVVEQIDGETEAALIYENHIAEKLPADASYLYMDVGGGSTEFTLFEEGAKSLSRSFKIGTIRLKENLVTEEQWEEMQQWLQKIREKYVPKYIIGSGGNINTLFKLTQLKAMKPLSVNKIKEWRGNLRKLTYEERIIKYKMRPDRADVILPAIDLFLFALKNTGCQHVLVPEVGLVDGIIHQLYGEYLKEKKY